MKIGIYSGEIPAPIFINNLLKGLADEGCLVYVYGKRKDKKYTFSNPNIIQKNIPNSKAGIFIKSIYLIIKLIFRQQNISINIIRTILSNSYNFKSFFYRCCKVIPPFLDKLDIFHIQWAKTIVQFPEFCEKFNSPIVLSLRGTHINVSPRTDDKLAFLYKKYFSKIDGFHAVNKSIISEVEKYGVHSNNITVINPAIDKKLLDYSDNRKKIINSDNIKIISVGRNHWIKGYTFALDSMVNLKKEGINFHYTIVSNGEDIENINYQIYDLGLDKHVTFIDGLLHEEVIDKVSKSDIFFLPSIEEGISNAVLEAMALGTLIISTDCDGMREVIIDDYNGYLINVYNANEIVEKVIKIINSVNNIDRIIESAKKTIIDNHILKLQISNMIKFYKNILNK